MQYKSSLENKQEIVKDAVPTTPTKQIVKGRDFWNSQLHDSPKVESRAADLSLSNYFPIKN